MECFTNLLDLIHISFWERASRICLERGHPFQTTLWIIGQLSVTFRADQSFTASWLLSKASSMVKEHHLTLGTSLRWAAMGFKLLPKSLGSGGNSLVSFFALLLMRKCSDKNDIITVTVSSSCSRTTPPIWNKAQSSCFARLMSNLYHIHFPVLCFLGFF